MNQRDDKQFFELYKAERFEDQLVYYRITLEEFNRAKTEAMIGSIIMIFLAGLAGIAASSVSIHWLRVLFFVLAAIFPIFSTALAAYSALYGFEQQSKLYQDTINNLLRVRALVPVLEQNLPEDEFTRQLNVYVQEVEKTFQREQGQWGQLAAYMKPPET